MVVAFLREQPLSVAFLVILLEIPRYSFAFLVLALSPARKASRPVQAPALRITAIVPVYNGERDIRRTVAGLYRSCQFLHEIIVVNDGSRDGTQQVLDDLALEFPSLRIFTHRNRAGKSAAVNHAARFARGDFLLLLDDDTQVHPDAIPYLARAFADQRVGAASGNILVSNARQNPLTALQSLEYLLSITVGRGFLGYIGALSCCSGAFTMFRKSAFDSVGGLNVGPGEDLEITLRLRRAGFRVSFVREAVAETSVPETPGALARQRLRWDRDALCIRIFMYRQMSWRFRGEALPDTLQRMDFIIMELLPTLVFPFYLAHLALQHGPEFWSLLTGFYIALFWLYAVNIVMAMIAARRRPIWLEVLVFPVMPLYQGLIMKLVRFFAFTEEILFSVSHRDPLVPERVRAALYAGRK